MSGGEASLLLIAVFVAAGLACVLRPPDRLLRRLGVPIEPTGEERRTAEQRARGLLRQMLGATEYDRLVKRGYLDIASPSIPSRLYRVPYFQGMVEVIAQGARKSKTWALTDAGREEARRRENISACHAAEAHTPLL